VIDLDEVIASHGPDDPSRYIAIADHFLGHGDRQAAAAALDRAYGLAPDDAGLARHRAAILDELAVTEHGLVWRYVPAGTFEMGSDRGDPDERPVHARGVAAFWITEAPITWTAYCQLMGWSLPPDSVPPKDDPMAGFDLYQRAKIRMQYCQARDGAPRGPERYAVKPMIAVTVEECDRLAAQLTGGAARFALPTEAQWERAARGGLVGKRFAWGDQPASPERCDFDHFGAFHIADPRSLPRNSYGLYAMCGGVWEWTRDGYDALAYRRATPGDGPSDGPSDGPATLRVLRGGSWSDCADACTVSYRMSRDVTSRAFAPNIGFRLVREAL